MDAVTELAMLFKGRENQVVPSITIGTVIKAPPEVEIRLNDIIVLKKDRLIFSNQMLNGYKRNVKFTDYNCGITTTVNDGGMNASDHNHRIQEINIDTTMEWVDTIVENDEVIIMPVVDEQLYYVLDKAVRLE